MEKCILLGLMCFVRVVSSMTIPYNVTDQCHRGMQSTMGSKLKEEVVTKCSNGTLSWNGPMNYLEVVFVPTETSSTCMEHKICFGAATSPHLLSIIENFAGHLTYLPLALPGKETCSESHFGNFTIAFESTKSPRAFAIYLPFMIKPMETAN